MPEKHQNRKFFNAVRALQNKDVDPEFVSKDVEIAARRTPKSKVEKFAENPRDLGHHRPDETRVQKRRKPVEEAAPVSNETLDLISSYANYGKALRQTENLIEIGMHVNDIVDMAEQIVLSETNDWFDESTVKRNAKEMKAHSKEFVKTVSEAQRLMERAQALYDDIGTKLNRYFDIKELTESQDGDGVEDDASQIAHFKPKTFDVVNMKEENSLEEDSSIQSDVIPSTNIPLNKTFTVKTVGSAKAREDALLDIVKNKTVKEIDGIKINVLLAKLLLNVLNALTKEENREKFLLMPIRGAVETALKLHR